MVKGLSRFIDVLSFQQILLQNLQKSCFPPIAYSSCYFFCAIFGAFPTILNRCNYVQQHFFAVKKDISWWMRKWEFSGERVVVLFLLKTRNMILLSDWRTHAHISPENPYSHRDNWILTKITALCMLCNTFRIPFILFIIHYFNSPFLQKKKL